MQHEMTANPISNFKNTLFNLGETQQQQYVSNNLILLHDSTTSAIKRILLVSKKSFTTTWEIIENPILLPGSLGLEVEKGNLSENYDVQLASWL